MTIEPPRRADVVVIGGGIAGLSALYHLALEGVTNTVLLERRQLACGTTWHSVGSVGQVRGSRLLTLLSSRTADMLLELERETGLETGYKRYGSIALALVPERLVEFQRTVSIATAWGYEAAMLTPREVKERYPEVEVGDVLGALYLPGDGRTNPVDTVQALANACRRRGAKIFEDTKVEDIIVEDGRVNGVRTTRGDIAAEKILLSAGMWSREIAERIGVHVPLIACEHFYAVTESIPGLPRDTPMVRVPDERTYYKEDAGKLLFGCLEEVAKPWGMQGIPEDFCFDSLPEDLEHFAPILEQALVRMPILKDAGIKLFFNGPESFTPDGHFHIGETAEVQNLFVSCGFNTIGVMASGGIGRLAAELMAKGHASWDISANDVKRAQPFETNVRYLAERMTEGLGKLYGLQCPDLACRSARGVRRSPLHEHHAQANAIFEHVAGWERAAVFAPLGTPQEIEPSYGPQPWHDWCADDCRAAMTAAAVLDQSALAKVAIVGPGARAAVHQLFGATENAESSRRRLILSPQGTVEAIVQVTGLTPNQALIIGGAGDEVRLAALICRRLSPASGAHVIDMTAAYVILDLFGSGVETSLARIGLRRRNTRANACAVDLRLGAAWLLEGGEHGIGCRRLLVPTDQAAHIYAALVEVGCRPIGTFALRAMLIARGIPRWGHEVDATMTPAEAGLDGLIGADGASSDSVLGHVVIDEPGPILHGREPIRRDGEILGWTLSGALGLDGRAVGIAYVPDLVGRLESELPVELEIVGARTTGRLCRLPGI
jgi:4-methylaminobutanoate oxidase (formaldehyde-forming)